MFSIVSSRGATVAPLGPQRGPRWQTTSAYAFPMARAAPSLGPGFLRSFAERAVVALQLMHTLLPGPPCYCVVAARSPSAVGCASFSRMRHNRAAHTDAREASQLSLPSQPRAG